MKRFSMAMDLISESSPGYPLKLTKLFRKTVRYHAHAILILNDCLKVGEIINYNISIYILQLHKNSLFLYQCFYSLENILQMLLQNKINLLV